MFLPYYIGDDGYNYVDTFDKKWITQHNLYLSGPKYCNNCKMDGMIENVFIGYCMDCAIIIFCGERGQGIKSHYTLNEWRYWFKLPDYLIEYENILYKYFYDERIKEYISNSYNKKENYDTSTIVETFSDKSIYSENTRLMCDNDNDN
jgi:hypothetical protein